MGVEQACESMQEDWKRLLLRMGSAVVQQAWDSAGGVQVSPNKTNARNRLT